MAKRSKLSNVSMALNPHSLAANSEQRGFRTALNLFHETARRVPAYKDFLKKRGIKAGNILKPADFAQVPLTDKQSYFGQYSLKELSWDGELNHACYISTSSGSTGVPFFWPRGDVQDRACGLMYKNIYEDIFGSKEGNTLVINSCAFGTWIAGFEFYNGVKFVADNGSRITIVTPGIDKGEAIRQFKKLASLFDRIVFIGYPPFVKDIIDQGREDGIEWGKHDLKFLTSGEAVSEVWKGRLLEMIGKADRLDSFVNVYGMAEAGVVGHDTPLSTLLKRNLSEVAKVNTKPENQISGLYQYYPEQRYFESLPDSSLIFTANAGLPLIRYDTRDTGGLLDRAKMSEYIDTHLNGAAKKNKVDLKKWQLPFVYLYGRKDLALSLYALIIYTDNVKMALENSSQSAQLSGFFQMEISHTKKLDQQFDIRIELAKGVRSNPTLAQKLTNEIVTTLCKVNSEYSKLLASIGDRAKPIVELVPFGKIETIPGRKHKWVKRS